MLPSSLALVLGNTGTTPQTAGSLGLSDGLQLLRRLGCLTPGALSLQHVTLSQQDVTVKTCGPGGI